MRDQRLIDELTFKMMEYDIKDPKRIQHFLKVHRFAQLIARQESADDALQRVVECAALVHDIGIRPAEEKYGRCDGRLQEQEGPEPARAMLETLGMEEKEIVRICYLVGHHHTYSRIDGLDYQILVEADFLVNFYEDQTAPDKIRTIADRIFKTEAGRQLCRLMYPLGGEL